MPAGAQNARSHIERGLACYGRGELQQALGQWREALRIDPGNEEAKKLVSFVEERMSAKTPVPGPPHATREPSPPPAPASEEPYSWDNQLTPHNTATVEELLAAEAPEGERKRRQTLVSTLPELLAPSTLPEAMRRTAAIIPAVSGPKASAARPDDGAPQAPSPEVITRPVGSEAVTPTSLPAMNALNRTDTPLDLALAQARDRARMLVRKCAEAAKKGDAEAAAAAAEEALEEADKAPAPGISEIIEPARSTLEKAFVAHLGRPGSVPTMAVDDATVNASNFDHRTGFLLSCIDGTLPVDTLIDISGMGRFEAVRTLSRLLRRRIIRTG